MTRLIEKNTTIPTKANQVFSTAADNQTAVTVHVLQGEREMASANKSLGRFDLSDIAPAPRGMPQIEVTFDIDANGILHVSAKDKATGKAQSIVIKASSGLSEDEVKNMIRDAEAHAAEDKRFHELVTVRNQADNVIHTVGRTLADAGDKLSAEDKKPVNDALDALREAVKGDDRDLIEQRLKTVTDLSGRISEKLQAAGHAGPSTEAGGQQEAGTASKGNGVVDAEFEEVKGEGEDNK